ncbi:hypothetical protein MTR67_023709 [Solanum verrucosum]|uniref:Uncharacterized protein n=1 Tax=Solanum verrucosum TaxID=315347 RepID=A0AAF0TB58_SOLVR|nr:hypothetical protein MTR67_005154 [Solanum verrucosum]WMV30324.1 hypothetical protein MTR67_023709 [Solanum verrucosum]
MDSQSVLQVRGS